MEAEYIEYIQANAEFSPAERDAVYKCIFNRGDVRGQFLPEPISNEVLARILSAAHHAPSVGFMQPWDFIVIRDVAVKQRVRDPFQTAHTGAAEKFEDDRRRTYRTLKLEGILEAPVGICVTCDRNRTGPVVISVASGEEELAAKSQRKLRATTRLANWPWRIARRRRSSRRSRPAGLHAPFVR
jgi:5,6-dimethylbenzimidazole synthase